MESDFYEDEIFYYKHRFPEDGIDLHFLTRLWGQERITFHGHEYKVPFEVSESFEDMSDEELRSYSAIIVPSAIVSDRLRYTDDVTKLPPATVFLARAFAEPDIIKGIICHGMWLVAPMPELVRGRPVVAHNNLHGDVVNMGAIYTDQDVVIDGDLVTGTDGRPLPPVRAGDHRHDRGEGGADGEGARARSHPRHGLGRERITWPWRRRRSKPTSRRSDGYTTRRTRATTTSSTNCSPPTSRATAARASRTSTVRPSSRN